MTTQLFADNFMHIIPKIACDNKYGIFMWHLVTDWAGQQGGMLRADSSAVKELAVPPHWSDWIIDFEKESDATMFVLKWGSK